MENTNVEKKKNTPVFVLKVVGNVVFYLVIAFLLLFSIMNINGGNKNEGFPNIFGKGILSVQSNSMEGTNEDSFVKGDLLIVDVFNEEDFDDLEVGDIVTFYDTNIKALNSHRIVFISPDGSAVSVQGDKSVKEYGLYDPINGESSRNMWLEQHGDVATLTSGQILGVTTGIWRGAGKTLDALQQYWLIIFVFPVFIFLIFEIFMVYKNVQELKAEKKNASAGAIDLEEEKAKLRAQILAEIEAEKEAERKKAALREEILKELEAEKEKNKE